MIIVHMNIYENALLILKGVRTGKTCIKVIWVLLRDLGWNKHFLRNLAGYNNRPVQRYRFTGKVNFLRIIGVHTCLL